MYSFWFQLLKSLVFNNSTNSTCIYNEVWQDYNFYQTWHTILKHWPMVLICFNGVIPWSHTVVSAFPSMTVRWSWAPIPTGFWAWRHPPKHLWNPRSLRYTCRVGVVWKGKGDDGEGGMNLVDGPSWVCDIYIYIYASLAAHRQEHKVTQPFPIIGRDGSPMFTLDLLCS